MEDDDIWQEDPKSMQESEWLRISSNFTNAGYREGITAGKESALQKGFDEGFAEVGAPLGRELGILRGMASALLSSLMISGAQTDHSAVIDEVRNIVNQLGEIRLSDIAPADLEAQQHAREHIDASGNIDPEEMDLGLTEELKDKKDIEKVEDLMVQITASGDTAHHVKRPDMATVHHIKERLASFCVDLKLSPQWS